MNILHNLFLFIFTSLLLALMVFFTSGLVIAQEPTPGPEPFIPPKGIPITPPEIKIPKLQEGAQMDPSKNVFYGTKIYVVWEESDEKLLFKSSSDGGKTFTPATTIDKNIYLANQNPSQIVISSKNTIYIVWEQASFSKGNSEILLKKSTDGGKTFTPETAINLSNSPGYSSLGESSVVVDSKNNLYVVWQELPAVEGKADILIKRIGGGDKNVQRKIGSDKLPPIKIVDTHYLSSPSIAIDSNDNIYVVWYDTPINQDYYNIFLKKSSDGGKTFTQSTLVGTTQVGTTQPNLYSPQPDPQIVVDSSNNIYVFLTATPENDSSKRYEIFVKKSTDGGNAFSDLINVSNSPGEASEYDVTVDSKNNLYIVWWDWLNFKTSEILLKKSTDGGKSFGSPIQITKIVFAGDYDEQFHNPNIVVDSKNNIYVAWSDSASKNDIPWEVFLKRSTDGGKTFTPATPINISNSPGYSKNENIAAR